MKPPAPIGFIGTGIMGGHMARRLAAAGFQVRAWNRTPEKLAPLAAHGVHAADSPGAALHRAAAAVVMLSTAQVVDEVLFAAGPGGTAPIQSLSPGGTVIVMSSIPVEQARRQAAAAQRFGLRYIDAPVSGGEPGAREGTLAILAGGDPGDVEAAHGVFAPLGRVTRLGPAGSGQLAKLANQIIVGGTLVAIAEALELARRGGADPAALRGALMGGFGDSKVLRVLGERMVSGNFTPGSPAAYQLKDMRAAAELASGLGIRLELLDTVIGLFERLEASGESAQDVSVIIREVARSAGRRES